MEIHPATLLHLFSDSQHKAFRLNKVTPKNAENKRGVTPDVSIFDHSYGFLLTQAEMPLLWAAGGINGQMPMPSKMQQLQADSDFICRGQVLRNGKQCLLLAVQEQKSASAVREFCVGVEQPYPIYSCRAHDGNVSWWEVQVDYSSTCNGILLPSRWTYKAYNFPNKASLFVLSTFHVQKIEVNSTLSPELFERKLDVGMIVVKDEGSHPLQVTEGGNLVPLGETAQSNRLLRILLWIALSIIVLSLMIFGARRCRTKP